MDDCEFIAAEWAGRKIWFDQLTLKACLRLVSLRKKPERYVSALCFTLPVSVCCWQDVSSLQLIEWWTGKKSVLCITGAGLSTESGIPDYRGHQGSYHKGHKPMIHQQFMESEYQRKRYWGRSLAGWKTFDSTQPNVSFLATLCTRLKICKASFSEMSIILHVYRGGTLR